jgi:hypothetical protein
MTTKTKIRKGHYVIKQGETIFHIVKKAMDRPLNTWGVYHEINKEMSDGYLHDHNGNEIWVRFGTGDYTLEKLYDNSYATLKEAEGIVSKYFKYN